MPTLDRTSRWSQTMPTSILDHVWCLKNSQRCPWPVLPSGSQSLVVWSSHTPHFTAQVLKKEERSTWYPPIMHEWLPRFSGELGNYCNLCCTPVHYWIMGAITARHSSVCSTKPWRVPQYSGNGTEGQTKLMAILHVYSGKVVFVWLLTDMPSPLIWGLSFVFLPVGRTLCAWLAGPKITLHFPHLFV